MLQLGKAAAKPETSVQDCVSTFSNTFAFYLQRCVTRLLQSFPSVRSVHVRLCVLFLFCDFSRLVFLLSSFNPHLVKVKSQVSQVEIRVHFLKKCY